ncbi:hypothetical protein [uncultured Cohaesibacter sp.]|uniref:hypothetical protein n=1 Tax=uncultured Cohaesibacter sp. TaxID=1002546 RepID=UPI0029C8688D|nr:hypothetical protein [uncultured Cohaesibacter sp.]
MSLGLSASIAGAFFQALNYTATQRCQEKAHYSTTQILLATQVAMGVILALPFLFLGVWDYLVPSDLIALVRANAPYAAGQFLVIIAIKKSGASIVSPLLTLKIPTLAVIAVVSGQGYPSSHQLAAIAVILLLAYLLSRRAGALDLWPAVLIVVACIGYAFSDMEITKLSKRFADLPLLHQVMVTVCVNYVFCAIVSLPVLIVMKAPMRVIYDARWIGVTWVVAVFFLLIGFNVAGVLEANVAQSLRGVFTILISLVLVRRLKVSGGDGAFKILLSIGMTAAVFLYFS